MDGEVLLAAYITAAYLEAGETPEVSIEVLFHALAPKSESEKLSDVSKKGNKASWRGS